MDLSKAMPRELIHQRDIRCRGFRRQDGLWEVDGAMEDTKA
jgi:hypothetical protein